MEITIKTYELIDVYNILFDDMKNENWEEIGINEQIYDTILEIINNEVIGKIELLKIVNTDDINNVKLKPIPPPEPKWICNHGIKKTRGRGIRSLTPFPRLGLDGHFVFWSIFISPFFCLGTSKSRCFQRRYNKSKCIRRLHKLHIR